MIPPFWWVDMLRFFHYITITNPDGKVLLQKDIATKQISLPNVPSGMYIVTVSFSNGESRITKILL